MSVKFTLLSLSQISTFIKAYEIVPLYNVFSLQVNLPASYSTGRLSLGY